MQISGMKQRRASRACSATVLTYVYYGEGGTKGSLRGIIYKKIIKDGYLKVRKFQMKAKVIALGICAAMVAGMSASSSYGS